MKLILMGTPDFVVPIFDRVAAKHEILGVFTRAPKPTGRNQVLTKTPVHIWAESKNIPVFTSIKEITNLKPATPDYIVVAAYGVILKQEVLDIAPCINIHPSLLPKYRGPSPMESAILNGDTESGVCLMQIALDIDAGDVLMCEKFDIGENEATKDIENKVSQIAPNMLLKFLENPKEYPARPQIGTPTFTKKITSADTVIDWSKPAGEIHNKVRAIGGRAKINGIDVKILKTQIINSELSILNLQPAGKKPMSWADFMNGQHGKCVLE